MELAVVAGGYFFSCLFGFELEAPDELLATILKQVCHQFKSLLAAVVGVWYFLDGGRVAKISEFFNFVELLTLWV